LVWLQKDRKEGIVSAVDSFICAEIPDPDVDLLDYALVEEFMMHGPCGEHNPRCVCMKKGSCSKHFPKDFNDEIVRDMPKSPSSQYGLKAQQDIDPRGIRVTNGPMR
jgi:hypothetical protein